MVTQKERLARLVADMEWCGEEKQECLFCGREKSEGHNDVCRMGKLAALSQPDEAAPAAPKEQP